MTDYLILLTVSILMLILTIFYKKKYPIILTGGLTLAFILGLFNNPYRVDIFNNFYVFFAFLTVVYDVYQKDINQLIRIFIIISGLINASYNLSFYLAYDFQFMKFLIITSLIGFVISIYKGLWKKSELGFMVILNLDFILRIF